VAEQGEETRLEVASSPHLHEEDNIERIMYSVLLALLPAIAASIYYFGWDAIRVYLLSTAAAEASELACLWAREKPLNRAADGSALVTGLLLAMIIPASVPWYCPVVGSAFAIFIAKHTFGGLGCNIWNPALSARIFLQFAWPLSITKSSWTVPNLLYSTSAVAADATTRASALFKDAAGEAATGAYSYLDLLLGNGVPGSLGETCKIALIIGGIYLVIRRCIDWRVPVFYIATVFVLTTIMPAPEGAPAWTNNGLYHVLSGGLMIGAIFMATDMVTTPVTRRGRIVFAVGCGLLVSLIRLYGGYPEGVAYSIVLMNTATPLIDRWVRPTTFGAQTATPSAETA